MRCHFFAAYTLVALLALGEPTTLTARTAPPVPSDSAAERLILGEMRAFYRDLDDRNWTALLDHFLPAKVTARWAPPADSSLWARLEAPPHVAAGAGSVAAHCGPRAAIAVVGDWARVRVRRCSLFADEAWLLRVSGRWKIVFLALATPPDPPDDTAPQARRGAVVRNVLCSMRFERASGPVSARSALDIGLSRSLRARPLPSVGRRPLTTDVREERCAQYSVRHSRSPP